MATEAIDDYLKAIYELSGDEDRAGTAAIAKKLDVAPASVTGMLRKLADQQPPWIQYEKHHGAALTDRGRRRALEIIRHHRLIELFLHDTLGYDWDEVHAEAEKLEHAISETFEDRIAEKLGHPEVDPHGHPIPRKDGSIPPRPETRLLDLAEGETAVISSVSDRNPEMLRYLSAFGIRPGVPVTLVEKTPFDGPLMLRVGDSAEVKALGHKVSREVAIERS